MTSLSNQHALPTHGVERLDGLGRIEKEKKFSYHQRRRGKMENPKAKWRGGRGGRATAPSWRTGLQSVGLS